MSWPSPRVFPGDDLLDVEFAKADSLSFCLNRVSSSSVQTQWGYVRRPWSMRARIRLTNPILQFFVFALRSVTVRKDGIFHCPGVSNPPQIRIERYMGISGYETPARTNLRQRYILGRAAKQRLDQHE